MLHQYWGSSMQHWVHGTQRCAMLRNNQGAAAAKNSKHRCGASTRHTRVFHIVYKDRTTKARQHHQHRRLEPYCGSDDDGKKPFIVLSASRLGESKQGLIWEQNR